MPEMESERKGCAAIYVRFPCIYNSDIHKTDDAPKHLAESLKHAKPVACIDCLCRNRSFLDQISLCCAVRFMTVRPLSVLSIGIGHKSLPCLFRLLLKLLALHRVALAPHVSHKQYADTKSRA